MTRWRTFSAIRQYDHLAGMRVVKVYKDSLPRRRSGLGIRDVTQILAAQDQRAEA